VVTLQRANRNWLRGALQALDADQRRSGETNLLRLDMSACPGIAIYFKDESTHLTGSLKHRLARSLFTYGICNGWIGSGTTIVESSSGSTAVSEAYFAHLLGLKFVAVMPRSTSPEKVAAIRLYGGDCHFVDDPTTVYEVSAALARELRGHYMDQFTFAERATDWRRNNIAEALFAQMANEEHKIPHWIVCSAGTGGTSTTIGRHIRYKSYETRLCLADPEASVFHQHCIDPRVTTVKGQSLIEGIGRPRVEPSFLRQEIDLVIPVCDAASIAAARVLSRHLGKTCGGSTGTNFWAVVQLAQEMHAAGENGSIVTLLCDSGERYSTTYYNDGWIREHGLDLEPFEEQLEGLFRCAAAMPVPHGRRAVG
jgi:cysteine synthase A